MDQAIELARAGRPTANLFNTQPLPAGTDSISIPRILTGTATAVQPNDNDPVQETDLTDNALTFPVRTIAGQQDIALQLLEQSPINFDQLVFRDLIADFNTKLNVQVLNGAGTSGTMKGIFNATGATSVVYTDATPTVGELYSKLAGAIQSVQTARFMDPNVWVMHPRRWAWFLAAVDTAGRPLVVPNQQGPMNAIGTQDTPPGFQRIVGTLMGLQRHGPLRVACPHPGPARGAVREPHRPPAGLRLRGVHSRALRGRHRHRERQRSHPPDVLGLFVPTF
jgi:hypothetical protein